MSAGKSSAVAAVAASEGHEAGHTPGSGESSGQADLLREFDDELGLFEGQPIRPPAKRGPGRPPGSANRTTLQLQGYLRARGYRDPAEFEASLISADPIALAKELGCEPIEVLKIQRAAANDLMPYFHQRQGPVEPVKPRQDRPLVMIFEGSARIAGAADDGTLSVNDPQSFQQVIEHLADPSHGEASHDDT